MSIAVTLREIWPSKQECKSMITTVAQWVVALSGVWLVLVSGFMLARPRSALQCLGKMASTDLINYSEILLRMNWGIALVLYAEFSKYSEVFRILGLFLAGTSAVLFLVPRKWHAGYASYWSNKLSAPIVRILAPFSLALGIFLIYEIGDTHQISKDFCLKSREMATAFDGHPNFVFILTDCF